MTANGLKSMLMTFEKVLNGEIPLDPDSVNTLMLGGIVAVLEETRGLGEKIEKQDKRLSKTDRRLTYVGILAALALGAVAAHTGWTWIVP
jgi:hypothetical protein